LAVIAILLTLFAMASARSSTHSASSTTPTTSRVVITNGTGQRIAGVANYRTRRSRLWANWDMTGNADLGLVPGPVPMEAIEARGVSYLRLRLCGDHPCWWRKEHSKVPLTANLDEWALADPFGLAALIRNSSVEVGVEEVRGVVTTHYDGTIDVERLLASSPASDREQFADLETKDGGLGGVPAALWLDERGSPRRIQIERSGLKDTWEYYDFGVEVQVALPPTSQIMSSDDVAAFMTRTR
jgi:hypothetical protein